MARSMWSGVVSFGLVTIPVKLSTATQSHNVAFHQLHDKCKTRIKERRWCPGCETEVDWEHIVKGYEYQTGEYVVLTDEDFETLPLPSKKIIDVTAFVALDEIDPIYFDSTYYIDVDSAGAQKPYKLLLETMEEQDVVGLATITFRSKERLCALRPMSGRLCLQTLFYNDEIKVNDTSKPSVTISAAEKKMAATLVDSLSSSFEPDQFKDKYQDAVRQLINAKLKGKKIQIVQPNAPTEAGNLMEMLQASLKKTAKSPERKRAASQSHKTKTASTKSSSKSAAAKSSTSKTRRKRAA